MPTSDSFNWLGQLEKFHSDRKHLERKLSEMFSTPHRKDEVIFEPLYEDTLMPKRQTAGSAGYDIHAYLKHKEVKGFDRHNTFFATEVAKMLAINPGDRMLIPTGFKARLPQGYEGQLRVRSSVGWKEGLVLPNAPATIDEDFIGEWMVILQNTSDKTVYIGHGDRIAQLVISKYEVLPFITGKVEQTTDRVGGIGSTGAK